MPILLRLLLIFLAIVFLFIGGLWIVVPILYGLPSIPTKRKRIRRALELAGVQPGETVYDLGAGDGRVLFIAAREFGAYAIGIEIEPVHCTVAWLRALFSGIKSRVSIYCKDFYKTNLGRADVVFVYLTSTQITRLKPMLEQQLRPGARVVSISADFEGWQPVTVDAADLIFLYRMPPLDPYAIL